MARIRDEHGRYLLLVNQGRLERKGERVLTPVGGGLEARPDTDWLAKNLGASEFEKGLDLRFLVPDDRIFDVAAWFKEGTGRETSSLREVREELVEEEGLLEAEDLVWVHETLAGVVCRTGVTTRRASEARTFYLAEVYDVVLSSPAIEKLKMASRQALPIVYFVYGEEITRGFAADGTKIGDIAQTLLSVR